MRLASSGVAPCELKIARQVGLLAADRQLHLLKRKRDLMVSELALPQHMLLSLAGLHHAGRSATERLLRTGSLHSGGPLNYSLSQRPVSDVIQRDAQRAGRGTHAMFADDGKRFAPEKIY